MDKRPEISEHEAEELIKGMGRVATVVVHNDGLVTATAISANPSDPRIQNEVNGFFARYSAEISYSEKDNCYQKIATAEIAIRTIENLRATRLT